MRKTAATLRIIGDDLEPDFITKLLNREPTSSQRRGEEIQRGRQVVIAKFGMWSLKAIDREPGNLESQIKEILDQLTDDISVWDKIDSQYSRDMFCGLFLSNDNDGYSLSASTLHALGSRGIELGLDIYALFD